MILIEYGLENFYMQEGIFRKFIFTIKIFNHKSNLEARDYETGMVVTTWRIRYRSHKIRVPRTIYVIFKPVLLRCISRCVLLRMERNLSCPFIDTLH